MARHLIKPRIDRLFRSYTEGLLQDLSKRNTFIAVLPANKEPCPNCIYDQMLNASTGQYNGSGPQPFDSGPCPVCDNVGTVSIAKQLVIKANVQYLKGTKDSSYADFPLPEGSLPQNFARVKVQVRYHQNITDAAFFMIDGIRYKRFTPPRKRGLQTYVISEFIAQRDD